MSSHSSITNGLYWRLNADLCSNSLRQQLLTQNIICEHKNVVVLGFISMCSCLLLLLHVCGVHNSKNDIDIGYSVGVACVSVVAIKPRVNGRIEEL